MRHQGGDQVNGNQASFGKSCYCDFDGLQCSALNPYSLILNSCGKSHEMQKGLRLEKRGEGNFYKVILHIGSTLIPVSDDIIEELQAHIDLPSEKFFPMFLDRVGYSTYLQEQIRREVQEAGDLTAQMSAIQQFFRQE